jgi:hypothetical protein
MLHPRLRTPHSTLKVILHYECLGRAESKFEAMQDTLMGNTVVENAKVTLIEIDAKLPVQPLTS